MKSQRSNELSIATEAAEWLTRLEEEGLQSNAGFAHWLTLSPQHVKAFLNITAVDRALNDIDLERRIDIDRLMAGDAKNVVTLGDATGNPRQTNNPTRRNEHRTSERSRMGLRWFSVAAAAGIVAVIAWQQLPRQAYQTIVGEQRTIKLADGSVVNLNPRSRIKLRFNDNSREVFLEGEALFKVQHDSTRPFRVHSGNTLVQVLGTQFNVHRRPSGTIVSVLEGQVRVSSERQNNVINLVKSGSSTEDHRLTTPAAPILRAGEEAKIDRSGKIETRLAEQNTRLNSARQPRLIFADDRLEDIAAEFNRWNHTQILIEDEKIASRLYTGAFDADDPQSLLAFLLRDRDLKIITEENQVVIHSIRQ